MINPSSDGIMGNTHNSEGTHWEKLDGWRCCRLLLWVNDLVSVMKELRYLNDNILDLQRTLGLSSSLNQVGDV